MNKLIVQFFHWYFPVEGDLWNHCAEEAPHLKKLGVTDVWLPPAYKSGRGTYEPGYAVYDLYDLGEFDQKNTVRTRHGTKAEYLKCITALHKNNISVVADIVFNHKTGGDEREDVQVVVVNDTDRNMPLSEEHTIKAHTLFNFPGRKGKYSNFIWDKNCFTGLCENDKIHLILNEYSAGGWDDLPDNQHGNFDFLLGNDIEFRNEHVREELIRWGHWYVKETGIDGFRLDALKHMQPGFLPEWLEAMKSHFKREFFTIGEYWKNDVGSLLHYIDLTNGQIQLFDVPLHFNLYEASKNGESYDLRTIFDNTLIQQKPELAITFVDNHDTQALQSLESPVDHWFSPIAHALILLRQQGIPCIFYPALYGAKYKDTSMDNEEVEVTIPPTPFIKEMMLAREQFALGDQIDYFADQNVIGWTRQGDPAKENSGCAVLVTNSGERELTMKIGERQKGWTLKDLTGQIKTKVTLNENGEGLFKVAPGSVSIWVRDESELIKLKK